MGGEESNFCRGGSARVHALQARGIFYFGTGNARGLRNGASTHLPVVKSKSTLTLKPHYFAHASSSLAQDTTFTCVVTALFLRPIFKVLGEVGGVRSEGQISLERTKGLTLLGASLAVLSSTALYINAGLFIVLGGPGKSFYAKPYLSMFVFGINLDSVLNDVGMLLACGVIKKITCETVAVSLPPLSSAAVIHAESAISIMPTIDNKACDSD